MRNILIILGVVVFMLLMVACNDSQAEGDSQDHDENVEEPTDELNDEEEQPDETEEQDDESESSEENKEAEKDDEKKGSQEPEEKAQEPQYYMNENGYFKPIDDANYKVVLLTIDDAPDQHALEMAKTLKAHDAPAIFFVNGHFMDTEEEKEIVRKIHDMGFHIGNHTYSHAKLDTISEEKQKEEITRLSETIEEVIGEKPKFFRPPNGVPTDFARNFVEEQGMFWMGWSFGYDYFNEYMEAEALEEIMLTTNLLGGGANILMHDREWTNKALPNILEGYQEQGFDFLDPSLIKTEDQ